MELLDLRKQGRGPKNRAIWVRVTAEQHRTTYKNAQTLGYKTISSYLRDLALKLPSRKEQEIRSHLHALKRIVQLMEYSLGDIKW